MSVLNPLNDSFKAELILVRDLLWDKGIRFSSPFSNEFGWFFRNDITRLMSSEGDVIQYIVYYGFPNEIALNDKLHGVQQ
jgi:hypothetical protein